MFQTSRVCSSRSEHSGEGKTRGRTSSARQNFVFMTTTSVFQGTRDQTTINHALSVPRARIWTHTHTSPESNNFCFIFLYVRPACIDKPFWNIKMHSILVRLETIFKRTHNNNSIQMNRRNRSTRFLLGLALFLVVARIQF